MPRSTASSVHFNQTKSLASVSTSDLGTQIHTDVTKWNPFEDPTPFNQISFDQMTEEDHIFGEEFDRIRQGSLSSETSE